MATPDDRRQCGLVDSGVVEPGGAFLAVPDTGWVPGGAGDFNGDGKPDLLASSTMGLIGIWHMDGSARQHRY